MALVRFRLPEVEEPRLERPFSALQREMNRLVEGFAPESWAPLSWRATDAAIHPSIDVVESEKAYTVTAELPGIEEKDIEITFAQDVLTLKGEKKQTREEKDRDYMRMERSYGSFYRSIPFPTQIDENQVKATFKNGVLNITCPKAPEALKGTKKIPIHS